MKRFLQAKEELDLYILYIQDIRVLWGKFKGDRFMLWQYNYIEKQEAILTI